MRDVVGVDAVVLDVVDGAGVGCVVVDSLRFEVRDRLLVGKKRGAWRAGAMENSAEDEWHVCI